MNVNLELNSDWRIDGMTFHPERHPHVEALKRRLWDGDLHFQSRLQGYSTSQRPGLIGSPLCCSQCSIEVFKEAQLKDDDWAEGYTAARPNNVYDGPWDVEGTLLNTEQMLLMSMSAQF